MPHFLLRARSGLFFALLCLCASAIHAQGTTPQTIQFLPIADRPVTSAPFYVVALPSSELPVTFTVSGPATMDNRRLLTLTGAGTVTITATQPGNTQYAAATQQLTFNVTPAAPSINWQPAATLTYGTPLNASLLNATATAIPLANASADIATVSYQLGSSQIAPGATAPTYPQTSPLLRYEGSTVAASTVVADHGGYIPTGAAPPLGLTYRVAFTCDCQQFEFVLQSRQSTYRLWVDGSYQSLDSTAAVDNYPSINFVRVQFPDKRARQIKLSLGGAPPFYGIVTAGGDTISAPQVPVGERVILFGDSWTGPTFAQPYLPPAQDGMTGSGFAEYLGEYFNWDYWVSGEGGEGFTNPGTDANGAAFPQRLLTDVCPFAPSSVIILGGVNDGSADEPTVQSAFTTAMSNLATCLPGTPVDLYGPQMPLPAVEAAFAAAAPGYSALHYVDVAALNWGYGSPLSADTGNVYLYFAAHPTPLGHSFIAEKLAMDLLTGNPTLLPAAYPLFSPAPATGAFSYSAAAGALLPAGADTVTATFTPDDPVNYSTATLDRTFTVAKATSKVIFFATAANNNEPLTAVISPQIGGLPAGSVAVSESSAVLATLQLTNAQATFDPSALTAGTHTLLFTYSGDANFTGSSNTTTVNVAGAVAPDFTLSATPPQLTIPPAGKGTVNLAITPSGALNASLALTCTGLPAGATCAFTTGSTVTVGAAAVIAPVSIGIASTTAALKFPARRNTSTGWPAGASVSMALRGLLSFGLLSARRRVRGRWAALTVLVIGALHLSGCGGSTTTKVSNPLEQSYSVQLQLTNTAVPSMTHATTVTVLVPAQ